MDFIDSYINCTMDTLFALKLALAWNEGTKPEFLIITDDDVYLNIEIFRRKLTTLNIGDNNSLYGKQIRKAKIFRPRNGRMRNYDIPEYFLSGANYPDYLSGAAYALPKATWSCLYRQSLRIPYFTMNDVLLTGYAREMCNFSIVSTSTAKNNKEINIWGHNTEEKLLSQFDVQTTLVQHYVSTYEIELIHKLIMTERQIN